MVSCSKLGDFSRFPYQSFFVLIIHCIASIIVYCLADLRSLARKGKLSGDSTVIARLQGSNSQLNAGAVLNFFRENQHALQRTFGKKQLELYFEAYQSLSDERIDETNWRIVIFDDEDQTGLVYAIALDR